MDPTVASDAGRGNWTFVASEDAEVDLSALPEALAAAPPEVATGGKLLPRSATGEACRICAAAPADSREHLLPRSAGNRGSGRSYGFDEWLARESLDVLPGGRTLQGGIFGGPTRLTWVGLGVS